MPLSNATRRLVSSLALVRRKGRGLTGLALGFGLFAACSANSGSSARDGAAQAGASSGESGAAHTPTPTNGGTATTAGSGRDLEAGRTSAGDAAVSQGGQLTAGGSAGATEPGGAPGAAGRPALCSSGNHAFVHPGALHTQAQLERVKAGIASHTEPYASAWQAFHPPGSDAQANAPLKIDGSNPYALQDQGHTMYQLAVYWALSGNAAYGAAAARMIRAWSATFTGPNSDDATLRVGLGALQMINAAELLRGANGGYAGFTNDDVATFSAMLGRAVYPTLHTASTGFGDAGWGTPSVAALTAAAIFSENCAWLAEAADEFKNDECHSVYKIVNDGRNGGSQYIGENAESGRDQGHVQGTVAHLAEAAEMAWSQGLDWYAEGNDLLLAGMDYNAHYNLGGTVPFTTMSTCTTTYGSISSDGRGSFSPVYELAWNHYHNRRGLAATFIGQVRALSSYAPETTNGDHPGLGTLLYTRPFDGAVMPGQ